MINKKLAIDIAEATWGKGGTTEYKCNRDGAYYFDCSAHGGYVVDIKCLTEEEYKNIIPLAGERFGENVLLFEEDCAWAVLEKFTDITNGMAFHDEAGRMEAIDTVFNIYYKS